MKMRATHQKTGQVLYFEKENSELAFPAFRKFLESNFPEIDSVKSLTMANNFRFYPVVKNYGRSW